MGKGLKRTIGDSMNKETSKRILAEFQTNEKLKRAVETIKSITDDMWESWAEPARLKSLTRQVRHMIPKWAKVRDVIMMMQDDLELVYVVMTPEGYYYMYPRHVGLTRTELVVRTLELCEKIKIQANKARSEALRGRSNNPGGVALESDIAPMDPFLADEN